LKALRAHGEELQAKINELMAARSHGGRSDVEERVQQEQLQAKD